MKRIILIEDDFAIRDSLSFFFKSLNISTATYPDGSSILTGDYEVPDLFLLDKQLSGVDGLELCRHLKSQPASQHIPVIMMSATTSVSESAKSAGADEFIVKPFKLKELKSMIFQYLGLA